MKLSILLPVWIINDDLYELTRNTLDSLVKTEIDKNDEWELIIIDNASQIGSDQLLNVANVYIRNKNNLGYPQAVNQGLSLAKGEIICVSNNDIKVTSNWWLVTKEIFEEKNVGSVHYKMINYNDSINQGDDVWLEGKERWCTGSFFCWRRKVILGINGMDINYGLGGFDDYDWQYRMRKKKWKSVYTNKVVYQHKDSSTQLQRDISERKESDLKNKEYFKNKFGEYPDILFEKLYFEQFKSHWRPFP